MSGQLDALNAWLADGSDTWDEHIGMDNYCSPEKKKEEEKKRKNREEVAEILAKIGRTMAHTTTLGEFPIGKRFIHHGGDHIFKKVNNEKDRWGHIGVIMDDYPNKIWMGSKYGICPLD